MNAENNDTAMKAYLRQIGRTPLLTPQEEAELARKIRNGDREARDLMIRSNLRLVVTVARDYIDYGMPLLDLISEGNIGLMKAVERFDVTKGAKLSTYAVWWIRQSIKRALSNQSKLVRLPVHLGEKMSKMRRVASQMSEQLGRDPTDDELGAEIGLSTEKIAELRGIGIRPTSLDAPISDDGLTEFGESVADEEAQTPFELLRDKDLRSKVDGLLEELNGREKKIIAERFGFGGSERKTLQQIGETLGVSRERIRQLENAALAKLRRALSLKEEPIGRLVAA
ncbi:MAG: polymerase primary sigma factor [Verrucomicrobiota bacterium]